MLEFDIWLTSAVVVKFLLYISAFICAGSMLFVFMLKSADNSVQKNLIAITTIAGLTAFAATGMRIALQAGQLLDDGITGMMDTEMLYLVTQGPLGISSLARALGLFILFGAVLITPLRIAFIPLGAILIALSFTFVGHATKNTFLLGSLLSIHLLAVSYWFGGLWPLYRLSGAVETRSDAGHLAHRFGQQASVIVPLLLIAGLIFAYYLVGSFQRLFGTDYGWVLIVKVIAVGFLLSLAALNKLRFVPSLLKGEQEGASHLRTSIRWETLVFLIIFAITAVLTSAVNLPEH